MFQISVLKAKINEDVGLPAGKQKLQYEVTRCIVTYQPKHHVKRDILLLPRIHLALMPVVALV